MRKIVITGANSGIGAAVVQTFLEDEVHIFAIDKEISNELLLRQENITTISFDLNNISEIKKLVKQIGSIDCLINNAGIINALTYDQYSENARKKILAINLEAPVELITHFAPGLIANHGRIINVSSVNGKLGHSDIWYGITKAGIINMSKSFAKALGSEGVLVNCVAPGPVDTNMLKQAPQERVKKFIEMSIEKRAARASEIADVIHWLATDSPTYLNGAVVDVNNGIRL